MSNVKKERFFGLMILVSMVTLLTLPCLADDSKKPILYDPRKQDSNNEAIFLMDDHGEAMPKHRILKPGQEHSKGFLCLCPNRMGNVPQAHECRRPHEHFANYDLKTVKWFKRVNNELHIEEAKKVCGEDASHRLFQSAIQMGRTYAEIGPDYSNGLESL